MAKSTSNVLTPDLGRAQGLAVGVLCLLTVVQLIGIGRTAWLATARKISAPNEEAQTATASISPPLPGSLTSVPSITTGPPPIGSFGNPGTGAPVLPTLPSVSAPAAPSLPAVGLPKTGALTPNAEVNELLGVVEQLRPLGDTAGILDVLKKAEVLLPNHPAVLKEFAQTYDLMGLTTKAVGYWQRIEAMGPQAGDFYAMAAQRLQSTGAFVGNPGANPNPPVGGSVNADLAASPDSAARVLGLGVVKAIHDPAVQEGDKRIVRLPILSAPNTAVDPNAVEIEVFFYDLVNGDKVEQTIANEPVSAWVSPPVDWSGDGQENLDVTYFLPKLTEAETKTHGRRAYYGYVVKLYYQHRLQDTAADPPSLLDANGGRAGVGGAGNGLLPPVSK
ncbi:MAG: hypothetical protein KDK97_09060 [Verrucomicrobiales bacterium]|nr:hypothetical protein [Verrucomicrobiales bacterium]MCP5560820.1 hypothetical protein [Verrucomicrobiaceae bacterium]